MRVGLDIGSTTIKCVVLGEHDELLYSTYERHYSHILEKAQELLRRIDAEQLHGRKALLSISGSAGMGLADSCGVPFVQEVFSTRVAVKRFMPKTDCVIELGGEDAKILFLTNGTEVRMNGSCAGGTGAFIDQMATLLKMSADEMNKAAEKAERTYTIASRCGVFAKSDVQPLINQGARTEDIAASIYKAVVNQTIAGLAQGRPIKGNILYLGGPLTFSTVLRKSFDETLHVTGTCPENSLLYVALGAAFYADQEFDLNEVASHLDEYSATATYISLPPLFKDKQEYEDFHARHLKASVPCVPFGADCGPVHIGIDSGSTTIKLVVIDQNDNILFTSYQPNLGNPLPLVRETLLKLYQRHPGLQIASVTTTGYGEELVKNAFHCDRGLVETVAHFTAAKHFMPNVDFIIDIGGQDMKCFKIEDGAISNIFLNEACSSGCGSFLQTFAQALGYDVKEFAALGLFADKPVDLGSRCTVFMNSSVKQAQKDGASIENISAGLSISVVKNALYKVIRASSPEELGRNIVVQGGTFYNEAVLRAFEKEMGVNVIRPDIAGLMGAYGAALYGKARAAAGQMSTVLTQDELEHFEQKVSTVQCGGCGNHCRLTMNRFPSGDKFFSGNRCDFAQKSAGAGRRKKASFIDWKLERLFAGEPLPLEAAAMGVVGIPRALNTYEHYPYWFKLFSCLGFRVELSRPSDHALASSASETVPSQSLCFPAKLAHGHAADLARKGIADIWMPCVPLEGPRHSGEKHIDGRFACPVAGGYPEAMRLSLASTLPNVRILTPFVDLEFPESVVRAVTSAWPALSPKKVRQAVDAAHAALEDYRAALRQAGEALWRRHETSGEPLIVLAGRPYHLDPLINHGLPALIESMGAEVVTEDAVAHLASVPSDVEVVNQWTFHSRLYRAAALVRESRSAELVQLMSFGCGIDAVTSEQIERLLAQRGRIATTLKIDEGDTLGAARIRLKSLLAALADRRRSDQKAAAESLEDMTKPTDTPVPLDKMLADRVIYAPQMAPIHFPVICAALGAVGWRVELLPEVRPQAIEEGLKHVNNDACYPAIVVIGQLLDALKTHAVDPDHSALLLAQTCGPCRATNYPTLLRWALKDLHLERVPVVCLSGGSIEGAQTLNVGLGGLRRLMLATLYGDMLQRLSLHVRSHELHPGDAQRLVDRWTARAAQAAAAGDARHFADDARAMVRDFFAVPMDGTEKIRVGIVGEILLKYHPAANLGIVQEIIDEGAEPVLGDLAAFFLYCLYDHINQAKVFGGPRLKAMGAWLMIRWFEHLRGIMRKALDGTPAAGVSTLAEDLERIDGLVSAGQEAGEGWLLTAEMVEFIHSGTPNVVCLQPFGCLPNHVTGKGVIRRLREENPLANICAIDFEAGTSKTNVSNRLKLFLAQARENFERGIAVDEPVPTAHRVITITPSANIAVDAAESPHKDRGGGQAAC